MHKIFFTMTVACFLNSLAMEHNRPNLDNFPIELVGLHMFPKPGDVDPALISLIHNFGFVHHTKRKQEEQKSKYRDVMDNCVLPLCMLSLTNKSLNEWYGLIASTIKEKLFNITCFSHKDLTKYTGYIGGNLPSLKEEKVLKNLVGIQFFNYNIRPQTTLINLYCEVSTINTMYESDRVPFGFTTTGYEKFLICNFHFWFKKQTIDDSDILSLCVQNVCTTKNLCLLFDFLSNNLLNDGARQEKINYYQSLYNYVKQQNMYNDRNLKPNIGTTYYCQEIDNPVQLSFSIVIGKEEEANLPLDLIVHPLISSRVQTINHITPFFIIPL